MTTIFIIGSILASIGTAFIVVQLIRLVDWLINKSIKHETEQKAKRFLPDADSDVWHPCLPMAPILESMPARFLNEFRNLKEHEYILVYIGTEGPISVGKGWKTERGLLISPIVDYATDNTQQRVIDPECIKAYVVTKQNV